MCKGYRKLGAAYTPDAHQGHHYISASPAPPYRRFSWCGDGSGWTHGMHNEVDRPAWAEITVSMTDRSVSER